MKLIKSIILLCISFLAALAITIEEQNEILNMVQKQLDKFAEIEVDEKLADYNNRIKRLEGTV